MDEATSFVLSRLEQDLGLEGQSEILLFAAGSLVAGCESDDDHAELEDLDEMLLAHSDGAAETYLPSLIQIREELIEFLQTKQREAREEKKVASIKAQLSSTAQDERPLPSPLAEVPEILLNMLPELDEAFIRHLLVCEWGGDVQQSVEDLLEDRDEKANALMKKQEQWKKEQQHEEDQARKLRQLVIERFALQEIKEPSNRPPPPPPKSDPAPAANLRYVGGQAVRTKDKYIVDPNSVQPEWDGGSRGRVKGKGKRGAGGVKLGAK